MARTPIHPGEILGDELEEIGLSAKRLADVSGGSFKPLVSDTCRKEEHNGGHCITAGAILWHIGGFLDKSVGCV